MFENFPYGGHIHNYKKEMCGCAHDFKLNVQGKDCGWVGGGENLR